MTPYRVVFKVIHNNQHRISKRMILICFQGTRLLVSLPRVSEWARSFLTPRMVVSHLETLALLRWGKHGVDLDLWSLTLLHTAVWPEFLTMWVPRIEVMILSAWMTILRLILVGDHLTKCVLFLDWAFELFPVIKIAPCGLVFPDPEAELDYSVDNHPGAAHPHSTDCRPLIRKIVTERDAALKRLARGRSLDGSDLCLEDTGCPLFILVPGTSFS